MSDRMRRSIRNKLMTMSVTIALIAIVLLSAVSSQGFSDMKKSSEIMSVNLVDIASESSEVIIQGQVMAELTNIAKLTSNIVDTRIQSLMNQIIVFANSMEQLYANPSVFGRVPVYPANAKDRGEYVSQLVYAQETIESDVADEVGLLGNMGIVMNQVSATLPEASSAHVGTESGFSILCDERPDLKLDLEYFDARERSWYTLAVENKKATWTEVFEDTYGRGLTVTCGNPVYGPDGEIKAVVAISCQLSEISSIITDVAIGLTGHAIVIDNNGDVILGKSFANSETGIVTDRVNFLESNDENLVEITNNIIDGKTGIATAVIDGKETYLAYYPMEFIPWTVVTLIDVNEVRTPILEGKAQTTQLAVSAKQEADKIATKTLLAMIAGMGASAVLALMVGIIYSNKIASPIRKLERGVREISKGKLGFKLEINTGDEIENLAVAFNMMTNDLKKHILELTTVTSEREKIGAELNVATKIQASMLPSTFPAFPNCKEFDIYASMIPAKEVGGDFYDFFLVDERNLGIVMADVSGKGVPAALFMVIAKTLIQNYAQKGESPADILNHTNNQLCQNNDASMFVTAWVAVLNIDTGELSYANAGHNSPLIKKSDGEFEYLRSEPGFVLAGLENFEYTQTTIKLEKGDVLYLYTDGVTEATNNSDQLYSDERLKDKINSFGINSLKALLENIKEDIDEFVGDAPQFDDITMLALRYGEQEE